MGAGASHRSRKTNNQSGNIDKDSQSQQPNIPLDGAEAIPEQPSPMEQDVDDIIRRTSLKDVRSSLQRKFSSIHSGSSVDTKSSKRMVANHSADDIPPDDADEIKLMNDKSILRKFTVLVGLQDNPALNNAQVITLVNWLLRLSNDAKRNDTMISLFTNCLSTDLEGLNYIEFCSMYENISSRVELERVFSVKFAMYDVYNTGVLGKVNTIAITMYILSHFAPIWCSKREIAEMKKKIYATIKRFPEESASKVELLEVYDSMLISMRLIHDCKIKFKEFDTNSSDQVDEKDIVVMALWMFKAYQRCGIIFTDEDLARIKRELLAAHRESHNQPVTINELAMIFEGVKEKKQEYYILSRSATTPGSGVSRYGAAPVRRLSTYRFIDISPTELDAIGISPMVREKFEDLDSSKKGYIGKEAVLELLQWMHLQRSDKGALRAYVNEMESALDGIDVDFDEFCSMYEDASLRIEQRKLFEAAYREHSREGKVPYEDLVGFLDAFMLEADKMECSVSDREDVKERLLGPFRAADFTGGISKATLLDLFEEACSTVLMLKHASVKFKELDSNCSGLLAGVELTALAEWYLLAHNHDSRATKPSVAEVNQTRDTIMARFSKSPGGEVTLTEMAMIHEELLRSRRQDRNAMRYKNKVRKLVAELITH